MILRQRCCRFLNLGGYRAKGITRPITHLCFCSGLQGEEVAAMCRARTACIACAKMFKMCAQKLGGFVVFRTTCGLDAQIVMYLSPAHATQVRVGDTDGIFECWVVVRAHTLGCRRFFAPRDHAADDNAVQRRGYPSLVPGL